MDFDETRSALCRRMAWLVVIRLDYCERVCGVSPCAATGTPYCYYTFATCRDPAHFSRGAREYRFSTAEGPRVAGALPLLSAVKSAPTEIRPEDSVTRRARVTLEFYDDAPLALANPDRAASNLETDGGFFKNLFARNPNLEGRTAEIWQGFEGVPVEDWRLHFRGVIDDFGYAEGRARVVIKDQLALLDKSLPPRQSSGNTLTASYSGGATMSVSDAWQFEAPGTVRVEDEYVDFSGAAPGQLTGCVAGRYGTSAVTHARGKTVKQVAVFADPDTGEGLPPDELFLRLLVTEGGLDPLAMSAVDRGAELSAAVNESALALPLSSLADLPETGVVRVDDELIRFAGRSGSGLAVRERGAFGTTAAAHDVGSRAMPLQFSDELGRWMAGTLYRRTVERSTELKNLVNELRAQCLLHVWQGEDSLIHAKCVAPPFYADPPVELDDEKSFIAGSTSWEPGGDLRVTRVVVQYAPVGADPGERPEDYGALLAVVDAEAESAAMFGRPSGREVFAGWIYREREAALLASRYLIRYRSGAGIFRFALELKDDGLKVGDYLRVTSDALVGPDGAARPGALFEALKKERRGDNRLEFTAIDTRLDRRYPLIAPASLTADYDGAGGEERERYGFVGGSSNRVGAAGDDGYYVY